MYIINQQIIDTFRAFREDPGYTSLSGLIFSKFLWINGVSANASVVTISEDSVTGGVYYLIYAPSVTGSHYINLFNNDAIFDADYYVTSGSDEIAANVWGYSISGNTVIAGSMGEALSATHQIQRGMWEMTAPNKLRLYNKDGVTVLQTFDLFDLAGNPSLTGVVKRVPA